MVKALLLTFFLSLGYHAENVRREPLVYYVEGIPPYYQVSLPGYARAGWRSYWKPSAYHFAPLP